MSNKSSRNNKKKKASKRITKRGTSGRTDRRSQRGARGGHRHRTAVPAVECIFSAGGTGFGFAVPVADGEGREVREDMFVPPGLTLGAMNGDTVAVRPILEGERGYGRGNEGTVVEILKRGVTALTGVFHTVNGIPQVTPDDKKLGTAEVLSAVCDVKEGDKVQLSITAYPDEYKSLSYVRKRRGRRGVGDCDFGGEVIRSYGSAETKEANYEAVLDGAGIPRRFSSEVLRLAEEAAAEPLCCEGRLDLRSECIFTIDGAGAKDLDDAISLKRCEGGYLLGVHIADVSHYVREGSAIDREAYDRGTSVYFVDKVVPMLPEALSNGACSLGAGEDKYALSALITLDSSGETVSYEFCPSVIRSAVRGVYSEVNDIIEKGRDSAFAEKYGTVLSSLELMVELYRILEGRARRRGALELEGDEAEIILDGEGFPTEILPRERGVAERIIEQFMLRANVAAASFLADAKRSGVYRIHEEPDREKTASFATFAYNMGLQVSPLARIEGDTVEVSRRITPEAMSRVLSEAKEKGIGTVVSSVMLRSLMKAKYSPAPSPHFGLAEEIYCHFTSPIRRYPDLFVHRGVKAALRGEADLRGSGETAAWTTETEIRAVTAERQIEDLYMALYMSRRIGESYDATVTGVTSFGIFARTDFMCEGMVPAATLGRDTAFNDKMLTLTVTGQGKAHTYRMGDRVKVTVTAADISTGKVTFSVCPTE